MSYDPTQQAPAAYASARPLDIGLQKFMQSIYATMSWGLMLTGLTAYAVANSGLFKLLYGNVFIALVVAFAPLMIIGWGFSPSRLRTQSAEGLKMTFAIFSVVMGLSFSALFMIYSGASLARVFFITAATFAGTSIIGYTTKRDLTGMGSFLYMGLFGILIAMLVNLFMASPMVYFVTSVMGVIIFTGLTAWETQNLKNMYAAGNADNDKIAVYGALSLYLKFVNLFQFLLSLLGDRR